MPIRKWRQSSPRHFDAALMKGQPTMNQRLRDYYGKIRQHFRGWLPEKVQLPLHQ